MIWNTVVIVAERVGVVATVSRVAARIRRRVPRGHPGALESLQALMNHSRIDTTQVYLKALNARRRWRPCAISVGAPDSWRTH